MDKDFYINPNAVVDQPVHIGNGTKIWHFSHIMAESYIGDNCIIGQNVFIASHVKLGNSVKVQNNVSIFEGVTCEEEVFLGPSMVFTNVINPRAFIERKDEFKPTLVRKGATIGANATIICGNQIGEYAMVGAGSVVTKEVKNFSLVVGNPARQMGWISKAGARLYFDENNKAKCEITGENYLLKNDEVYCESGS